MARNSFGLMGLTILLPLTMAPGVAAADLGGTCCADIEERIADLEARAARKGNRKVSLTVSGLINETLMAWDDGFEQNAYVVTNETKRSRLKFSGQAKISDDVSAGYVLELGPRAGRQDRSNQNGIFDSSGLIDVRYSNWQLKSKSLGTLSLGLQQQASDTVTEVTVANTDHFARPAPTQQFGDGGKGFFLRLPNGKLSKLTYGNIVSQGFNGTPGEGHRLAAVRYDTPVIAGFTASASWGEDDFWDAALRYTGEFSGFKFAAAAGYAEWADGNGSPRGCAVIASSPDVDCQDFGLSASIMHLTSGLFATGGFGSRNDNNVRALYGSAAGVSDTQDFYFVQAGIEQKWFSIGKTTIFGEYWHENTGPGLTAGGKKLDAAPLGADAFISAAGIAVWGAGINQSLADGVDIYLSYRRAVASVFTSADGGRPGSVSTEVEPFQYVTAGMAIKF
jgi:predicted porin